MFSQVHWLHEAHDQPVEPQEQPMFWPGMCWQGFWAATVETTMLTMEKRVVNFILADFALSLE